MADLIIKPATGDGNKLILQDKAGGAVLTTADSGATIANATLTSPTLNSPTLVTPALGTPSAINLTNATYPAGHIIQFVTNTGDASSISTSSTSYATINVYGSITPKVVGSKIYVHAVFNIGILVDSGGGDSLYSNIYRSGSSVTDAYIEQDGYTVLFPLLFPNHVIGRNTSHDVHDNQIV